MGHRLLTWRSPLCSRIGDCDCIGGNGYVGRGYGQARDVMCPNQSFPFQVCLTSLTLLRKGFHRHGQLRSTHCVARGTAGALGAALASDVGDFDCGGCDGGGQSFAIVLKM